MIQTGTAENHTAARSGPAEGDGEERALRGRTWALLGALLARPPQGDLLAALRRVEADAVDDAPMQRAWAGLGLAARHADPAALDDEYHALFIGVGRGEVVPYGSWYLTGLLMEKPLAALRAGLARLGIERAPQVCEPEDHAAALCESMGLLAGDPEIPLEAEQGFFGTHVEPWLGRFFEDLARAPSAGFYAAVAVLGQRFLDLERRWFSLRV
jgi:TorA maturation chaperone TorD